MKLLALPVLFLALAAADPAPEARVIVSKTPLVTPQPDCDEDMLHVADQHQTVQPKQLDKLPQASMELAVWVTEDGCTVPQVVMEEVER